MKKIWFLILCSLLAGCSMKTSNISLEDYNNQLISLQEHSVDALQNYYKSLETSYDGTNLATLYDQTLQTLHQLQTKAQESSDRKRDAELKTAVVSYISGLQSAFQKNEQPIVEALTVFSGLASDFYKENKQMFSATAMQFAREIAQLDKQLEMSYHHFSQAYNLRPSPKAPLSPSK